MRKLTTALAVGAVLALGATACTKPAGDAAKPGSTATKPAPATVVTVNGTKVNQVMVDTFLQAVTGKPPAEATKEQRDALVDQLVNMTLAAQAAEKDGLAKDPEVQAKIELIRMQVLAEAASDKYAKAHPVSDSEVKAEYDAQVAKMPKEYKARHILVENKEAAEAIIKQLASCSQTAPASGTPCDAEFAKIAKAQSKDPGSAAKGGELDWFSGQSMVKPFTDALGTLQKGQITQTPVQTQYGFHVIQLEDTRAPTPPEFDQVKEQVRMLAQRKKLQTYLDELRKTAQVQKSS